MMKRTTLKNVKSGGTGLRTANSKEPTPSPDRPQDPSHGPHNHEARQSNNPNAVWCRRPDGVLWRFDGALVPHKFKALDMPKFVHEKFIEYFMSNEDYVKVGKRMGRDAKLDKDDGDPQMPQIAAEGSSKQEI